LFYKHPLLHLVDDVYRHPCGIVAPKSAINHHGARKDLRALVTKYRPLAGAGNALTPNQINLLLSDALDSALATRNEHDYQPDKPVDGSAVASPAGTTWSEVAADMELDDIVQKPTTREGRAAEKTEAKQLTEPRLQSTKWLDQFSIDKEKEKKRVAEEKKRVAEETKKRVAEEKKRVAEETKRVAEETKKRVAEEKKRVAQEEKKRLAPEKKRLAKKKKNQKKKQREIQLWHALSRQAALERGIACKRQRVSQPAQQQQPHQHQHQQQPQPQQPLRGPALINPFAPHARQQQQLQLNQQLFQQQQQQQQLVQQQQQHQQQHQHHQHHQHHHQHQHQQQQ
jgi:hypothetical protein